MAWFPDNILMLRVADLGKINILLQHMLLEECLCNNLPLHSIPHWQRIQGCSNLPQEQKAGSKPHRMSKTRHHNNKDKPD